MKHINLSRGYRRILELTGGAVMVVLKSALCVEKVDAECND
jgi:hypothetical protein